MRPLLALLAVGSLSGCLCPAQSRPAYERVLLRDFMQECLQTSQLDPATCSCILLALDRAGYTSQQVRGAMVTKKPSPGVVSIVKSCAPRK